MEESIAKFATEKLINFIDEESNALGSLPGEIQSLKYELSTINSVLQDAEKKADDDNLIKQWLNQVRDVSYRIEDTLDEYFMLKHKKQASSNFLSKGFRSVFQLKPKHELISNMKEIANEIREIDSRRKRYGLTAVETITNQAHHHSWENQRICSAYVYVEDSELVGVEGPKAKLLDMLNVNRRDVSCYMIAVVGMGGLGKTTLVGKVYRESKKDFDLYAWITVSQSYNTVDIMKSIYKQFREAADHKKISLDEIESLKDLQSVINEMRNYLEQKKMRFIIVLDDVWDAEMPVCIRSALYSNCNGSRIFMTTRDQDVANRWIATINGEIYNLKPLTYKEAWDLFCNKVFGTMECPKELEKLSNEIVEKCNGLPLAIVAIGGVLYTKRKIASEWRMLRDTIGSEIQTNSHLSGITRILLLSYHELPYNLKPCFLYLGMFPEDYSISCKRLARLWIAEEFVKCYEGKTFEDVAQEYLIALVHRNLVQVSQTDYRGRIQEIRVHDILHKIILSQLEESGFCQVLSRNKPMVDKHFRRLSIHDCINEDKDLRISSLMCKFRSVLLTRQETVEFNMFFDSGQNSIRFLRVLDLQDSKIHKHPQELGDLYHLQYLSLRQTEVRELPKTRGQLCNLKTLDLKGSLVSELPKEVKRLHNLRHLQGYFYNCEDFFVKLERELRIPEGVLENFKELQKLAYLNIRTGRQVVELASLKQLTRLGVTNLRKEDGVALCQAIQKMKHLKSLNIEAANQVECMDIQVLESPPLYLETLKLIGLLERLPNWITKLSSLVNLVLQYSRLNDDPVSLLQGLLNLTSLVLKKAYDGEALDFGINEFPKLEKLRLWDLPNLKSIKGSIPLVRDVEIISTPEQVIDVPHHIKLTSELVNYAGRQMQYLWWEK